VPISSLRHSFSPPSGQHRKSKPTGNRRAWFTTGLGASVIAALVVVGVAGPSAEAATAPVDLGTAASFAVLAGTTVTNTGNSVLTGDLGLSPGTSITGFPPGTYTGSEDAADGVAAQAQSDLTTAYNVAAGASTTENVTGDLGGLTLTPGVYTASSSMTLNGTLTLSGSASSVFIFQAGSTLTTGATGPAAVSFTGGANACNVFWQVGTSATLDTLTKSFAGSILAYTSATLLTGVPVDGRVLARNGAVTLDDNTITVPTCNTATSTTTPTAAPTVTATSPSSTLLTLGQDVHDVATVTGNSTDGTPTGTVQFFQCGPGSTVCSSTSGTTLAPAEPLSGGVATSPTFTPGAVGTYCFAAVYAPAAGSTYVASSEAGSTANGECFTVQAVTSTTVPTTPTSVSPTPTTPTSVSPTPTSVSPTPTSVPTTPTSVSAATTPTSTSTSAVIPPTHTGEPWAGWLYWLLVGILGMLGIALVGDRAYRHFFANRSPV